LGRAYEHAKADARVRMNFAVVLSLEGRQAEAENLLKADLPPDDAKVRIAELKRLVARTDGKSERSASRAPGTAAKPD